MVSRMKTTINMADNIFLQTKKFATLNQITFKEVVERALRNFLEERKKKKKKFKLRHHTFRGRGLARGLQEGDWHKTSELIYEGRGG